MFGGGYDTTNQEKEGQVYSVGKEHEADNDMMQMIDPKILASPFFDAIDEL